MIAFLLACGEEIREIEIIFRIIKSVVLTLALHIRSFATQAKRLE